MLEYQDVHLLRQRLVHLLHVGHRQLDALALVGLTQLADDAGHALAQGQVGFRHDEAVREPLMQAHAATDLDRVLLEESEARRGPTRVQDAGLGALDRVGELGGLAGDPREMLQEVQGRPLRPEHADRRAGDARHQLAAGERHAVGRAWLEGDALVDQLEHSLEDRQAGQDTFLVGDQLAAGLDLSGEQRLGGEIAVTDVLRERLLDQLVDGTHREAHGDDGRGGGARLGSRGRVRDRRRTRRHAGPPARRTARGAAGRGGGRARAAAAARPAGGRSARASRGRGWWAWGRALWARRAPAEAAPGPPGSLAVGRRPRAGRYSEGCEGRPTPWGAAASRPLGYGPPTTPSVRKTRALGVPLSRSSSPCPLNLSLPHQLWTAALNSEALSSQDDVIDQSD